MADDLSAVCFFSASASGALCAGSKYNGSAMESWAQWVVSNTFIATALTSPYSEPTGTDFSSYFYLLDPNGDTLASDGVDFSTFRF